ncbi:hypothetical protein FSP39_015540 [Pinctada imbricata]|uniref:Reelin domain-containing protein n=1 Tax=Pinctada imbricata TaxID=66713 RepID=A0AA88XZJ8_PINIB|nr:hypothetical protein FSP39_015540 [Pinctada imbricata]
MYTVLSLLSLVTMTHAFPAGPPLERCQDMIPGHGPQPQTGASPYTVTMNTTSYSANDVIEVTVTATSGNFRGVFVQARPMCGNTNIAVGTFNLEQGEDKLQLLDCNGNTASAVAHRNNADVTNRTFYWRAPSQSVGHIYFRSTFVQTRPVFWVGVQSPRLQDPTVTSTTCPTNNNNGNSATSRTPEVVTLIIMAIFLRMTRL